MSYISYKDIINHIDIKKGDRVFVSSDVRGIIFSCRRNGERFDVNLFIDSMTRVVGETGTLVFPTFNWGFCSGKAFDYHNTPSEVGSLTNAALKREDFKRTKHPIYSFAVWGKGQEELCALQNKTAFGLDSPFGYFYDKGFKNLFIDVTYHGSATFVHFNEEKIGVSYRFHKDFTAQYIDETGLSKERTYSLYVRPIDMYVSNSDPMGEVYKENNATIEYVINDIPYILLDMKTAYDLVDLDIIENDAKRISIYPEQVGLKMYALAVRLFPICRSITGNGVRETLDILKKIVPKMAIHEVPTGTEAFDWTVPKEWNINDAYVEDLEGNRVLSFADNNLHVVGYSAPFDKVITHEELLDMVTTIPKQPDVIPYVTSYYKERSGFCMTENQKNSLNKEKYHALIDSELKDGSLTYGEILIPGQTDEEIFLSTYICHPSMANNEISGPCVAIHLAEWLLQEPRRYSYRIIFIPETIGSLTYLSRNLDEMKQKIIAGFNISCVGDDMSYSYIPSRDGNTLADRVAKNILRFYASDYKAYSWLERGSDERQYCAPGIDLPVCSICRTLYGKYPEYHTSADNLDLISPQGLSGAFMIYQKCIEALEANRNYKVTCLGEPHLSKHGLYPTSGKSHYNDDEINTILNFISYADGQNDLIAISDLISVPVSKLKYTATRLMNTSLIVETQ